MSIRDLASKASRLWFSWTSFKLGFFIGCIVGMIVEAILITVPRVAMAVLP